MTDGIEAAAVLALAETECYLDRHDHLADESSCRQSRTNAETTLTTLRLSESRARAVVAALARMEISPDDQAAIDRRLKTYGAP